MRGVVRSRRVPNRATRGNIGMQTTRYPEGRPHRNTPPRLPHCITTKRQCDRTPSRLLRGEANVESASKPNYDSSSKSRSSNADLQVLSAPQLGTVQMTELRFPFCLCKIAVRRSLLEKTRYVALLRRRTASIFCASFRRLSQMSWVVGSRIVWGATQRNASTKNHRRASNPWTIRRREVNRKKNITNVIAEGGGRTRRWSGTNCPPRRTQAGPTQGRCIPRCVGARCRPRRTAGR